jgi:hypothetical protein
MPSALIDGEANVTDTADSYVCGIADAPLLGDTIGRTLDQAALRWASREALVSPSHDVRWTWAELAERVDALAAGFLALGLERGARIGVWSLNRPEWTLTNSPPPRPASFSSPSTPPIVSANWNSLWQKSAAPRW